MEGASVTEAAAAPPPTRPGPQVGRHTQRTVSAAELQDRKEEAVAGEGVGDWETAAATVEEGKAAPFRAPARPEGELLARPTDKSRQAAAADPATPLEAYLSPHFKLPAAAEARFEAEGAPLFDAAGAQVAAAKEMARVTELKNAEGVQEVQEVARIKAKAEEERAAAQRDTEAAERELRERDRLAQEARALLREPAGRPAGTAQRGPTRPSLALADKLARQATLVSRARCAVALPALEALKAADTDCQAASNKWTEVQELQRSMVQLQVQVGSAVVETERESKAVEVKADAVAAQRPVSPQALHARMEHLRAQLAARELHAAQLEEQARLHSEHSHMLERAAERRVVQVQRVLYDAKLAKEQEAEALRRAQAAGDEALVSTGKRMAETWARWAGLEPETPHWKSAAG
eukprot:scaffold17.g511.t1